MKTRDIIDSINNNFASTYKNATPFINSGDLWDFCIRTIENPMTMSNIAFANDLGIPPVKSLLTIYEHTMNPKDDFKFTAQESQFMGALMGYVFKFVLDYQHQKERCSVNRYGVRTATRFLMGPVVEFEN